MKKTRRPVTLLELLIAMTLTMLVLSVLTYFYQQINTISGEMEVQQEKLFKQLYLSTRLNDIIPKASSPNGKKPFFFYTTNVEGAMTLEGSPDLVFTYDNGIRLDPNFSNQVLGRLFIDRHHRLCLAVWPSTIRWEEFHAPPMKSEVLMENVENIAYRFYIPPKKDLEQIWNQARIKTKLSEGFPQTDAGEWKTEWKTSWGQLPAIVEIILTPVGGKKEEEISFSFPLPNSNFFVVYPS